MTISESCNLFNQEFYKSYDGVEYGSLLGQTVFDVFYATKKKFAFKIVLLNLNWASIEGTLIINSYLIYIKQKILKLLKSSMKTPYRFLTLKQVETIINNKFTPSVSCKSTLSRVFSNFESFIPKLYK